MTQTESGITCGVTCGDLMRVALNQEKADLAITGADVVNVYSGEVLRVDVLVKGEKIAYVGDGAAGGIGPETKIIDATGKVLVPGFVDGHTHVDLIYSVPEIVRYALAGGTTTIITETTALAFPLGYAGVREFLNAAAHQPVKIYFTAPPMVTLNPSAAERVLTQAQIEELLRREDCLGLGEIYWAAALEDDPRIRDMIAATLRAGKQAEGHSAGARDAKLQAYAALGICSCHEPITADEALERLRAGLFVYIRDGEIREDLADVAGIKDSGVDFGNLGVTTDGIGPWQLVANGYMEGLVQKTIDVGFPPVRAFQMASYNVARHFGLGNLIGGIAPGRYADILVLPDLNTVKPELVISSGRPVARAGELLVPPRTHQYPAWTQDSLRLPREFTPDDFKIPVDLPDGPQTLRVMDLVSTYVTHPALLDVEVCNGEALSDPANDIIKITAIERSRGTGLSFTGLIRGLGIQRGAVATSAATDCWVVIGVGANDADLTRAVNRVRELKGAMVVVADGEVLAEMETRIGGIETPAPMERIAADLRRIQDAAESLGCVYPDMRNTMTFMSSEAVPFLRICEHGYIDMKRNTILGMLPETP
jgi:adenine deaminase